MHIPSRKRQSTYRLERESPRELCFECRMPMSSMRKFGTRHSNHGHCGGSCLKTRLYDVRAVRLERDEVSISANSPRSFCYKRPTTLEASPDEIERPTADLPTLTTPTRKSDVFDPADYSPPPPPPLPRGNKANRHPTTPQNKLPHDCPPQQAGDYQKD